MIGTYTSIVEDYLYPFFDCQTFTFRHDDVSGDFYHAVCFPYTRNITFYRFICRIFSIRFFGIRVIVVRIHWVVFTTSY